jgi:hypothetical protein
VLSRALAWVFRVLVIVTALQFSGLGHAISDVVLGVAGLAQHGSDGCPYEERGDPCPPGCPDCHCAPGAVALPPVVAAALAVVVIASWATFFAPPGTSPSIGSQHSVYRPPRDAGQLLVG